MDPREIQPVVVTDVRMSFGAMVNFMVKWAIASIPAVLILSILFGVLSLVFGGFLGGLAALLGSGMK